jgi:hypothetical protein
MRRPLALVTAAACLLLLASVVGNWVAIRESSPVRTAPRVRPLEPEPTPARAPLERAQPAALAPGIANEAESLAAQLLGRSPLADGAEGGSLPYKAETRLLMDSKETGRWVTLTEVRVPCAEVDRALARAGDPALGRPDRCDRWIETTAAVLERHGVAQTSAREFLERNAIDTSVRVLFVYAGWRVASDGNAALAAAESAAFYPRERFALARSEALDAIYRELRLGPYTEG